jgi:uncharacterized protein YdiU (UPF0061 family)
LFVILPRSGRICFSQPGHRHSTPPLLSALRVTFPPLAFFLCPRLSTPANHSPTAIGYPVTTPAPAPFRFDNSYARLPARFYARVNPTPVASPTLIKLNTALAIDLGIDPAALATPAGIEILAGNRIAPGSEPLAQAYAGSQFGYFVPQLGDGRANLLGEQLTPTRRRFDIQLKGSGPTPFSRRGDGRAALGPVLREYLVSESMAALGVPTTRALAAVLTGEPVFRETPLPGAILTRVASSHIRVGTFQYFLGPQDGQPDIENLRILADYAIARHYPHAAETATPIRSFLAAVIARQAALIAHWMSLGFIHGVMNTDNMAISGESIDFGPCAFMEAYNPRQVFSSIDRQGRYAFSNQPAAAHWNLARFAETLLPLLEQEAGSPERALDWAHEELAAFAPAFERLHLQHLRAKLGLTPSPNPSTADTHPADATLIEDLLSLMSANQADYTLTFRRLAASASSNSLSSSGAAGGSASPSATTSSSSAIGLSSFGAAGGSAFASATELTPDHPRHLFTNPLAFDAWSLRYRDRLAQEPTTPAQRTAQMLRTNPLYIPRNHLVEAVIAAAVDHQNFDPFEDLLATLLNPWQDDPTKPDYAQPARPEQRVQATFCGT